MGILLCQYMKDDKWYFKFQGTEYGPYTDPERAEEDHEWMHMALQEKIGCSTGSCES